jgi:SAM-dependent methyltransferase
VPRALDVGCGAGLSTGALKAIADYCIGLDPAEAMLRWTRTTAPGADCVVARAEAIPLRSHSIDLITAAGSLNYANLPIFFKQAKQVLVPGGIIVAYDFFPGSSFTSSGALDQWFSSFTARYPWPLDEGAELDPGQFSKMDHGFQLHSSDHFEIGLTLTLAFYLEYLMTETNVAFAQRNGESEAAIRSWCSSTLGPVWGEQPMEILFRGYFACLVAP